MPAQHGQVERRDQQQEEARDAGPDDVRGLLQVRVVVLELLAQAADAEVQQDGQHEHHAGVPEREEEPGRQRSLALTDQLAGGVVDGGDVVGVEGVPHAERVGQRAGADAEDRRLADLVVAAQRRGQHGPAHEVQANHGGGHAADPRPLGRAETLADLGQAEKRISHQPAFRLLQLPGPAQSRGNCELVAITCLTQLGRHAAPPLTRRIWPLTQDAPGLTRYATASAISS